MLDTLYFSDDAVFIAAKIDDAIVLLVAAALVPGRDVTVVIAARSAGLTFDQRGDGRTFVQAGCDNANHAAPAWRSWFKFYECHKCPILR